MNNLAGIDKSFYLKIIADVLRRRREFELVWYCTLFYRAPFADNNDTKGW